MAKKQMVSTAEAAEMLGLSERTVQKYALNGTLRAHKEGVAWKIEKTSVKELIRALKKGAR